MASIFVFGTNYELFYIECGVMDVEGKDMNENGPKYDVISATDLPELILKVQVALDNGWVCHGGLAASSQYLYQVIVRNEPVKPDDSKWV